MQHPDPITAHDLSRTTGKPEDTFTEALAAIDQDALFTTEREQLVASVWDQTSPVNGVDAEVVLGSLQVPSGGSVVTIGGSDGTISILQPFNPNTPGVVAIAEAEAQSIADAMADGIAAQRARAAVMAQLPAGLADPRTDGGDAASDGMAALAEQLTALQATSATQQESIDWLAGVVIDLSTGEAPTE